MYALLSDGATAQVRQATPEDFDMVKAMHAACLDTVTVRERSADVASLRPVFSPESVAVVGASRCKGTVGRSVLDNISAPGGSGDWLRPGWIPPPDGVGTTGAAGGQGMLPGSRRPGESARTRLECA